METDEPADKLARIAERMAMIDKTARCPKDGAPIHQLTNGTYICGQTSAHQYYRRTDLDGDLKWWHGRFPRTGLFIMALIGLSRVVKRNVRA